MKKKRKIAQYIFATFILLLPAFFVLNYYLTIKLENYLKKELVRRTTEATDGFYTLAFDSLSISFLKGELQLKGVDLRPDSAVFREWQSRDSLPPTYVAATIGNIDFRGVNLVWNFNYRELSFVAFEVDDPDIHIYDAYYSGHYHRKTRHTRSKTLYEVISPYMDKLHVETIKMQNAHVAFTIEDPRHPVYYRLVDIDVFAYDFKIDSSSFDSGKLLYCDNFEVVTRQPQHLLQTNEFDLRTDSIRISTADSVIYIHNTILIPTDSIVNRSGGRAGYTAFTVDTVEVDGALFTRRNALNYLSARSLNVLSSTVKIVTPYQPAVKGRQQKEPVPVTDPDSLWESISLYNIISPVFRRIAIGRIHIDEAAMEYVQQLKKGVESYTVDSFSFYANRFLIDSLAEERYGLWYSRDFAFDARHIRGSAPARNQQFYVGKLALDMMQKELVVDTLVLRPLGRQRGKNYLSGRIQGLRITDIAYDKGVSAGQLVLDRPDIRMVTYKSEAPEKPVPADTSPGRPDPEDILNPFLEYLLIKNISINRGSFGMQVISPADTIAYQLDDLIFRLTGFCMNKETILTEPYYFSYDQYGFTLPHFDNYVYKKDYRLVMDNISYSTGTGKLTLSNIDLQPQDVLLTDTTRTFMSIRTPRIEISGFKQEPYNLIKNVKLDTYTMYAPEFHYVQPGVINLQAQLGRLELSAMEWDSIRMRVEKIEATRPWVELEQRWTSAATVAEADSSAQETGNLYDVLKPYSGRIEVGAFHMDNIDIYYRYLRQDGTWLTQQPAPTTLRLEELLLNNTGRYFTFDDLLFKSGHLAYPLDNGFYTLFVQDIELGKSYFNLDGLHYQAAYPKEHFAYLHPKHADWFDVTLDHLRLEKFDLSATLENKMFSAGSGSVSHVVLKNFKNRKLVVPPKWMPMVYEGLQKAPFKLDIAELAVTDFSVEYEELAPKGIVPGRLLITDLTGSVKGLTNVVKSPGQYIDIRAGGKFMEKGSFTGNWMIPVDSLNDHFILRGHLSGFHLPYLNRLITPLAFAKVENGWVNDFSFEANASSTHAEINMLLLYRDLEVVIFKEKDGEVKYNPFITFLANAVVKNDNPDHPERKNRKPREAYATLTRDPYHSTFNYFWQILRPPLIESVGISQRTQKTAAKAVGFINRIKRLFKKQPDPVSTTNENTSPYEGVKK
ncbi:MAG: hypothetical protein LUD74_00145 [Tannerellaceae bacterium]|nr:hypothetical protein [Tannerellaceae bacterium]